jgi:hypothetical protein
MPFELSGDGEEGDVEIRDLAKFNVFRVAGWGNQAI